MTIAESPAHDGGRHFAVPVPVALALGWIFVAAHLLFFDQWIRETLWIFGVGIYFDWLLAGVVLLGTALVLAVRRRSRPYAIAAGVMVVALAAAWFGGGRLAWIGSRWLLHHRFERDLPRYEAVVQRVLRSPPMPDTTPYRARDYLVDEGPPRRVAFPWPGGMLDNWSGIVYDPTGVVLRVTRLNPDWSNSSDPSLQPVMRLFGGTMYYCERVRGPWYFCRFT